MRADIIKVWVDDVNVNIQTSDGQVKSEKIADYYRLCNATPEERQAFEYDNMGIHWSELDEDLSYEGFFDYVPSPQSEIRNKLGELPDICNMGYIAQRYFGKTRQWLYQRLNGNIVNGKPAQFTKEEIKILNEALQDISKKINAISIS